MKDIIVNAYVDKHGNQDKEEEGRLPIEKHPNLPEGDGCVLAAMIVDAAKYPMCLFVYLTHTAILLWLGMIQLWLWLNQ